MKECKKSNTTKKVRIANFYAPSLQSNIPTLEFDEEKLDMYENSIRYMIGQLHAVHTRKQTMIPSYGAMNYNGKDWTNKDNLALFSLYYLATASLCMPPFEKAKNGGVASEIGIFINLKPTYWPPLPE